MTTIEDCVRGRGSLILPDLSCSVCRQATGDHRHQCDACRAIACQICARTDWDWDVTAHVALRRKCRVCRHRAATSSIVQQCLERARDASDPSLSAVLYDLVVPWLPPDQRPGAERHRADARARADAQNRSLDQVVHALERRAQAQLDLGQYATALELWATLYEIRPDDDHVCAMMVKTQVRGHDTDAAREPATELALDAIRARLDDALETACFELAVVLCELALELRPRDPDLARKRAEAQLKRAEQMEPYQPSPVAGVKAALLPELEAARDQGDAVREAALMRVLRATLIQEHRHYQALGDRQYSM